MDPARFDHWTRKLTSANSRRAFGLATLGSSIAAILPLATAARKRKKKKKCKAPRERCGKACCQPGVPCIGGVCGCPAGAVACQSALQPGPVCLEGACCPVNCAGDTCCPSGANCVPGAGGALTCVCTNGVICGRACCNEGLACAGGTCQQCQADQRDQACGVRCSCVTTIENGGACINTASLLQCTSCASSTDCGAGKICIVLPSGSPCPQNRACVANVCNSVP